MGESESSSVESGDLLRRDCFRALGFGVGGSPVGVLELLTEFSAVDAEASLFRFEVDFGGGTSTVTVNSL